MSPINKVAVFGGSGSLGDVLVPALLSAGFQVTCVTRPGSSAVLPDQVAVKSADYSDVASLTKALEGQDAAVEAFNPAGTQHQRSIVQALIAAGVGHIVTPSFSEDTFNGNLGEIFNFDLKIQAQRELEKAVAASDNKLSWTSIILGPWYDWNIERGIFWVNPEKKIIVRYGSGDQKFSMSRVALTGESLVAVLKNPERYRNRPAYFASHSVTTNQLISIVKEDLGLEGWTVVDASLDDIKEEGKRLYHEDIKNGVVNRLRTKGYGLLCTVAILDPENRYGGYFGDKVEPGWNEGETALRENLKKLLT